MTPSNPSSYPSRPWLHRSIYYLAAGFMFLAVTLRAIIIFQEHPLLTRVVIVLATWLLLFLGNNFLYPRKSWIIGIFACVEICLILYLLLATGEDFFAILFAVVVMQTMQRWSPRVVSFLIISLAGLTFISLVGRSGSLQALALALIYSAVGALMAAYIWSSRQAGILTEQQQALVKELQETNLQLEFHARQQEKLSADRERQRLGRELHDSVTQTLFSMTLTTQSALLLWERNPALVVGQLDRLDQLAGSARAEMQELISQLSLANYPGGEFIHMLQQHLAERERMDGLKVTLKVEGNQPLAPAEEAGLFRITQEALNNIIKHAGVLQAAIHLQLADRSWMEIIDQGIGFEVQTAASRNTMGLAGMRERAAEIGWDFRVQSSPGRGTKIRIEKR